MLTSVPKVCQRRNKGVPWHVPLFNYRIAPCRRTCLHFAALFDHSNILTLLIKTGLAGLDVKDYYKETPLRMAIRRRKYASITTLVKFGASLAKTKLSNFKRHAFNKAVEEEKTKAAIAKGQRLSGNLG